MLPGAAGADPARCEGAKLLNEAFTLSKKAATEAEYDAIIALCERGKVGVAASVSGLRRSTHGLGVQSSRRSTRKAGAGPQALADFEAAVRLSGAWRAIHNRGVSYAAAGRMEEAMPGLRSHHSSSIPRYSNAYYNRGGAALSPAKIITGAIDDYSQAIKLGPPDAATFNGRGHAFYRIAKVRRRACATTARRSSSIRAIPIR